jgi:ADP-heptose:LPS heptosyltransferase
MLHGRGSFASLSHPSPYSRLIVVQALAPTHRGYAAKMAHMRGESIYLAPIGSGVGDVIVALPAFAWLAAQGSKPYLVARGPRQLGFEHAIPELAGVVREPDLPDGVRYINLRDHAIQRNYDWYGEAFDRDYPGFRINEIMALVCRDKKLFPDFNTFPRLTYAFNPAAAEKVVLVPGTTSDFKAMPTSTWLSVVSRLSAAGLSCIVLGEPDRSPVVADLLAAGVPHHPTPLIQLAIDTISSARACISVDTGLMHVAVQQGIPTVAIFNSTHTYYRPAPNCHALFAPACAPECALQSAQQFPFPAEYKEWVWWEGEYDYCRAGERHCMSQISADAIVDVLLRTICGVTAVAVD